MKHPYVCYVLGFLCLFKVSTLHAQAPQPGARLALLGKARSNSLDLRWAPLNARQWADGNRYGYWLLRTTWQRDGKQLPKPVPQRLNPSPLRPAPAADFTDASRTDKYCLAAKGLLYETQLTGTPADQENQQQARFAFSLLCADLSLKAAELMCLRYLDRTAKPGERYRYALTVAYPASVGHKPVRADTATLGLDLNKPDRVFPLGDLKVTYIDRKTAIRWNVGEPGMYSAYIVERSDDAGVSFNPITKDPIIQTADGPDQQTVAARDSLPRLYQHYQYRVRGITPFAEPGPPSDVVDLFAYQTRLPPPLNASYRLFADNIVGITWQYPDSLLQNLSGFQVLKTTDIRQPASLTTHVGLLPTTARYHLAKLTDNLTYFQVLATDLGGRPLYSDPVMVEVADSVPPLPLREVRASVDKKGVVRLRWKPSPEKDLMGYAVYRGNESRQQLIRHSTQVLTDTTFTDTIPLYSTNKYVFYSIVASDNHLNESQRNDTLAVPRPDIIPPLPPVLTGMVATDSLVRLDWQPSPSDDLHHYELLRAILPDTSLHLIARFDSTGRLACYEDRQVVEGNRYRYQVEAVDQSGLRSGSASRVDLYLPVPRVRPALKLRYRVVDEPGQTIELAWDPPVRNNPVRNPPVRNPPPPSKPKTVVYYTLWRSSAPLPPAPKGRRGKSTDNPVGLPAPNYYKRLEAGTTTFTDRLTPGWQYGYVLTATLADESVTQRGGSLLVQLPTPSTR